MACAWRHQSDFSPSTACMMGTRCGNLDPGVVLHLIETKGMASRTLTRILRPRIGSAAFPASARIIRTLLASEAPGRGRWGCSATASSANSGADRRGGGIGMPWYSPVGPGEHAAEVRRRVCLQLVAGSVTG